MESNKPTGMSQLLPPIVFPENLSESDLDLSSEFTSEGGESTAELEELPSPNFIEQLVACLEFYFGDESLARDLFLLKHIKRQPEGYVSLKLLAGYKKIKKLSRNWRIVGMAAKTSEFLEVNESGTRVKRKLPLPSSLAADLPASRTLLAVGVPPSLSSIEALAKRFAACGPVAALQLVKPSRANQPELQAMVHKFCEGTEETCAVVEFEDVWGAMKALQDPNEPLLNLKVLKMNKRRTPELRQNRPFHYQMNRLMMESGSHGSESSGSEGDDLRYLRLGGRLASMRYSASMPNSPAPRRCPFVHGLGIPGVREMRSPRGPDGSKGFDKSSFSAVSTT